MALLPSSLCNLQGVVGDLIKSNLSRTGCTGFGLGITLSATVDVINLNS